MKKTVKLNKMLGLNQNDVAMLMGITRSQWSMFESGKRQLPYQATLLLSEILNHLNDFDNQAFENHQQEIAQKKLKKMQHENEFKRHQIERKIENTTRKLNSALGLQKLVDFVKTTRAEKLPVPHVKFFLSQRKKMNAISELTELLTEQQHQKEMLDFEKKLLESKLKKNGSF